MVVDQETGAIDVERVFAEVSRSTVAALNANPDMARPLWNMDIRNALETEVGSYIQKLGTSGQYRLVSSIPGGGQFMTRLPPHMMSLESVMAWCSREAVLERLQPFLLRLYQQNYEGRVVAILLAVGSAAAALALTPASMFVRQDHVDRFCGLVDAFVAEGRLPDRETLREILDGGSYFFMALRDPGMGVTAGITEDSIGFTSGEIENLFRMISDLHHLNRSPETSEQFRNNLQQELEKMPEAVASFSA